MAFWLSKLYKMHFSTTSATSVLQRNLTNFANFANFGILFDIDGVIMKGSKVLPQAIKAFDFLTDEVGNFCVPVAFVTNAGSVLRQAKADQLSETLGVKVEPEQVVMSHSPFKMFKDYHQRHVLVVGQGSVREFAKHLGFNNVSTIDDVRSAFPTLDAVDHQRRILSAPLTSYEIDFPRIDSVLLFGEPIRWETSLQLLIDILVTNGLPSSAIETGNIPYPHLPILACNMDLLWSAEAPIPRFGHGAFLLCLENLYKKVTDQELDYTALIGKPSEITFRYSEDVVQKQAQHIYGLSSSSLRHIYFVGDNVCTDVFGANLYDRYLQRRAQGEKSAYQSTIPMNRRIDHLIGTSEGDLHEGAERCFSILVETGVYSRANRNESLTLNHFPRDFLPVEKSYQEPFMTVPNVLEAVKAIFAQESFGY